MPLQPTPIKELVTHAATGPTAAAAAPQEADHARRAQSLTMHVDNIWTPINADSRAKKLYDRHYIMAAYTAANPRKANAS